MTWKSNFKQSQIFVEKWFLIAPKRLMLAIICVWQYLLWLGPDPPPTPPLISSIHYNTMSQERRGWPNQDYTEPLNQRGNKGAWTLKGCFDFVVVVIMFHECWVLLKVEELCLCPMDKVNNAVQFNWEKFCYLASALSPNLISLSWLVLR